MWGKSNKQNTENIEDNEAFFVESHTRACYHRHPVVTPWTSTISWLSFSLAEPASVSTR